MDHQAMWKRLYQEMTSLMLHGVKSIDPHIVLDYIGFLEEIEEHKDEQSDKS